MLIETSCLKVGLREPLQRLLVKDILKMLQLANNQQGMSGQEPQRSYRQRKLQNVDVQVFLALGHSHRQGTANAGEEGQKSERSELHGDSDSI